MSDFSSLWRCVKPSCMKVENDFSRAFELSDKEYKSDKSFSTFSNLPKNIDESMKRISYTISEGINHLLHN